MSSASPNGGRRALTDQAYKLWLALDELQDRMAYNIIQLKGLTRRVGELKDKIYGFQWLDSIEQGWAIEISDELVSRAAFVLLHWTDIVSAYLHKWKNTSEDSRSQTANPDPDHNAERKPLSKRNASDLDVRTRLTNVIDRMVRALSILDLLRTADVL
jgi:hypothetical protein